MAVKLRFESAVTTGIVLAKVGNPQREEPLQTSREVFRVQEEDQSVLTSLFLKPFKNLVGHRFYHHSSLDQHEMNNCVKAIFESPLGLLERGCDIAKRLYSKSNHPNIKAGDLCVALMDDLEVDGQMVQGICILKAESMVPFLSINAKDGDLQLSTEHGINPEKIDKGCLILNHFPNKGFYAVTFDRAGAESRFWVREFLGLQAVPDSAFLTNAYADMTVNYLAESAPWEDSPPEQACAAVHEAMTYFDDRENFDLQEFEERVLRTPEAVAKFAEHRARVEEAEGQPLETNFEIAPKIVQKAKKRIPSIVRLDTGVEIHLKPLFVNQREPVLERGFDETKGMKFIKVYFNQDITES
jgi:37-kD nucleoid-associated bacterial protein